VRIAWPLLVSFLVAGCDGGMDYSVYSDARRPMLSRIGSLDARLRELLGDAHPDSGRVARILDTLDAKVPAVRGLPDYRAKEDVSGSLEEIGLVPVPRPGDSDLVPSLAWERRRAGCVPLALFWTHALRRLGDSAVPVFLPGHLAISSGNGRLIEPMKMGIQRGRAFYDSVFQLGARPYYAAFRPDSGAVLASMLVQSGLIEWRDGRKENARSAFQAAANLCPGLPEAEGNLGLVMEELGREDEAKEHLESAVHGDRLAIAALGHLDRLRSEGKPQ
jgi:tetratricopeptide (TPR) repeat protein